MAYIKYNGLHRSRLKVFVASGSTDIFEIEHHAGNIDVNLNGSTLTPMITSTTDTDGSDNLTSGNYDYRSGNYSGGTFTEITTAQSDANAVKLETTPSSGDKLLMRVF
jgi:hypothetical protein